MSHYLFSVIRENARLTGGTAAAFRLLRSFDRPRLIQRRLDAAAALGRAYDCSFQAAILATNAALPDNFGELSAEAAHDELAWSCAVLMSALEAERIEGGEAAFWGASDASGDDQGAPSHQERLPPAIWSKVSDAVLFEAHRVAEKQVRAARDRKDAATARAIMEADPWGRAVRVAKARGDQDRLHALQAGYAIYAGRCGAPPAQTSRRDQRSSPGSR